MNRAPSAWQISTSPMSSSIGLGFWKPKKIAVRPLARAASMSAAALPGRIRSACRTKRSFHASTFATVSRKLSW